MLTFLQDLVETIRSKEGTSVRGQIVTLLSQVITWSTLPRWTAVCTAIIFKAVLSLCSRALKLGGPRKRRRPKLINLRKGMRIMNVELNRVALKRLHLGALIALDRLWKESKWTTFCSVFISIQLIVAALFKKKQAVRTA